MQVITGKSVYSGAAVGKIRFFKKSDANVSREKITDPEKEIARFERACSQAEKELNALYEKALSEVGETNAQIFDIHIMMLSDGDYLNSVREIIQNQLVNAEYAAALTSDNFASVFSSMEDEYMRTRAADVRDISNRLIRILSGKEENSEREEKCIILADDLAPSETVSLDKSKVLAFVTKHGSLNSHTAILARTMNIPAIIGADGISPDMDGKTAAVDGFNGKLYIEPDDDVISEIREKEEKFKKRNALLEELKGKENITLDGTKIKIYANISGVKDIGAVLLNDAGGIGLFRSEFLYLESDDYPDEQTQFNAYKKVLESMSGKKVIIRTLDIGADKKIGYFDLDEEENPALGFRAIRICLERKDVFKTQLRALYRASVYGNLAIMFPMITSAGEITEIYGIIHDVKSELWREGLPFSERTETGIMIETPAAAVISDELAPMVDFFSVGTNDLIQYTLAADRQNPRIDRFINSKHDAIIRLVGYATKSAHRYGKWIGICGELAADTSLTECWLRMGIDELSVSPPFVLEIRDKVRSIDLSGHEKI